MGTTMTVASLTENISSLKRIAHLKVCIMRADIFTINKHDRLPQVKLTAHTNNCRGRMSSHPSNSFGMHHPVPIPRNDTHQESESQQTDPILSVHILSLLLSYCLIAHSLPSAVIIMHDTPLRIVRATPTTGSLALGRCTLLAQHNLYLA